MLPVNPSIKTAVLTTTNDNTYIIDQLLDETHQLALLQAKFDNEKQNRSFFDGFSDLEMIYYYVHQRKDIQTSKQRKQSTKMEYIRELIQFYKYLKQSEDFIRKDVEIYHESSLFKNLKQRHIEAYQ